MNAQENKNKLKGDLLQVKPLRDGVKPIVVDEDFVERCSNSLFWMSLIARAYQVDSMN